MRRILYITIFSLIFLLIGLFLQFYLIEALPIALLGGCLGWAVAEFRRETNKA
ncbi:hypothetical protein [Acinetobacter puyangensis]|uniref:hypothetical protein n=1 Tax=Acinetobacter puyangensis TaxID=1096779 RepID=UPI003A4D59ED